MKLLFSQAVKLQEAVQTIDEQLKVAYWPEYRNQRGELYPAHMAVYCADIQAGLWLVWEPYALQNERVRNSLKRLAVKASMDADRVFETCKETVRKDQHDEEFVTESVVGEAGKPLWVSELSPKQAQDKVLQLQEPARQKVKNTRLASYFDDEGLKHVCRYVAKRLDHTLPDTIVLYLQPKSGIMDFIASDWQKHFAEDSVCKADDDRIGSVVIPRNTDAVWLNEAGGDPETGLHAAIVSDESGFKLVITDIRKVLVRVGSWQDSFVVHPDGSIWLKDCRWADSDDAWEDDDERLIPYPDDDDDEEEED